MYQLKLQELLSREGGSEGVIIQQLEETYGDEDDEENQDYDPANAGILILTKKFFFCSCKTITTNGLLKAFGRCYMFY